MHRKYSKEITLKPKIVELPTLFNQYWTTQTILSNLSKSTVVFKIKTTAPKNYCVQPRMGRIPPNCFITINIFYQPINTQERKHDRFLVVCAFIPDNTNEPDINELTSETSSNEKYYYKFKIMFSQNAKPQETNQIIDIKKHLKLLKQKRHNQTNKIILSNIKKQSNHKEFLNKLLSKSVLAFFALLVFFLIIFFSF
ncbi:vesicle-associated membrane protein-associated protein b/c [Anaeramoeba ignava]|uniref:Vesicle-associated membrane protein-associated protein b/c n=1 Tax=Anaeramoeba ignava TaxID=1746090 RepID=A0A9Q0LX65_ANAIG|nr:vesicle-associated membrane protein-associated protein b/c [Anaeramoeba ignava]|eukprot:Anaeramoba_ignava/a93535_13.p1 GENE.a93535_13~~a93535_13.p1  ORF type:complete len:197 (-),score=40.19 a93535_13:179-769(-)